MGGVKMSDEFGISSEEFANNISKFSQSMRELVETFLTNEEIRELNNPKTSNRRKKKLIDISTERMLQGEIKQQSSKLYDATILGKIITNKEITRDSILEIIRNRYKGLETIDIEIFLDKLSEETLEVILKDLTSGYLKHRCNDGKKRYTI